jgi:replicative DNA helicase
MDETTAANSVEGVFLSSLLANPSAIVDCVAIVKPEDFAWTSCRILFTSMLECFRKFDRFDLPTLRVFCGEKLANYGGMSWVLEVYENGASGVMAEEFARQVAKDASKRRFLGGLEEARISVEGDAPFDEAIRRVPIPAVSGRCDTFDVEEMARETVKQSEGLSSGWPRFDEYSGVRFRGGDLVVAAGRTGHCKTTFLVNLFFNWMAAAFRDRERLLFYSCEEPKVRIYHRLLALVCGNTEYPSTKMSGLIAFHGGITGTPGAVSGSHDALKQFADALVVVHEPEWSIREIIRDADERCTASKVRAIFVDYLQRIPPQAGTRYHRRDLEIAAVARGLKNLASRRGVPVIVGAQVNRKNIEDGGKMPEGDYGSPAVVGALKALRPKLHQLREGGSEQEADVVLGLHSWRADYAEDDEKEHTVPIETRLDIGTLKERYGASGRWASMRFNSITGRIEDAERNERAKGYAGDGRADLA